MEKRRIGNQRLKSLRKSGEAIHHRRDPKIAKDGRIRTFRLTRGIKLERAVKGKR